MLVLTKWIKRHIVWNSNQVESLPSARQLPATRRRARANRLRRAIVYVSVLEDHWRQRLELVQHSSLYTSDLLWDPFFCFSGLEMFAWKQRRLRADWFSQSRMVVRFFEDQ